MPEVTIASPMAVANALWAGAGGDPRVTERLAITGPTVVLPSTFAVTATATAAIAAATMGVAELARHDGDIAIDTRHAAAAVRSERYLRLVATELATPWDPIAGDYPTADGWIRLHTNYVHHREAVLRVLGVPEDREAVGQAVRDWAGEPLERAVLAAGGCAATMFNRTEWRRHPHGERVRDEPVLGFERIGTSEPEPYVVTDLARPLRGLRVLDLTHVLSGPVATRFLASWGADVLRVETPGFEEIERVVIDVGFGKRSCGLDLRSPAGREAFDSLVATADVVVHGYRPGALAGLGYGPAALAARRPGLVISGLSAYGSAGPWGGRRGFDSLVQMSAGIADEGGRATGADRPVPLPCQLLDHATGYLVALGAVRGLMRRSTDGGSWNATASLARTAAWLDDLGLTPDDVDCPEPTAEEVGRWCTTTATPWGDVVHVAAPGSLGALSPRWDRSPTPVRSDAPTWLPR
jgi:Arc/MetJ family transcription regulator